MWENLLDWLISYLIPEIKAAHIDTQDGAHKFEGFWKVSIGVTVAFLCYKSFVYFDE